MHIDHKHTWTLPRDSWTIRFYIWLWSADDEDVNFCKILWGYIFAIPCLIVRALAWPFLMLGRGARALINRIPQPKELSEEESERRKAAQQLAKDKRDARAQKVLRKIEHAGSWVVMWISYIWRFTRYPVVALAGLILLGAVGTLGYLAVTLIDDVPWPSWGELARGVAVFGGAVTLCGVLYWMILRDQFAWVPQTAKWTAPKVKVPFRFFFWVMKMGYISVKSNTCPRVVLTDTKDES